MTGVYEQPRQTPADPGRRPLAAPVRLRRHVGRSSGTSRVPLGVLKSSRTPPVTPPDAARSRSYASRSRPYASENGSGGAVSGLPEVSAAFVPRGTHALRRSNRRSQMGWRSTSPQMGVESSLHSLGTGKLSRLRPQGALSILHQARSTGWGFVVNSDPQAVDKISVHRGTPGLSTGNSQDLLSCPQEARASPHLCPLFGNTTPLLTAASERRHTEVVDWAVGNLGKAGDSPGEKSPGPVHRVCRTFGCPQKGPVIHGRRPQVRWTKNRF